MSDGRGPRVHSSRDGEFMLAFGPASGPQLLVLQPLFEEMNRCRALVATLCRLLAGRGIGCWLPDLPGTGESPRALESVGWDDWTDAIRAAASLILAETGRAPATAAVRGGALLDRALDAPRWRLSPTSGRALLSDLRRSALAGGGDPSAPAGYRLPEELQRALAEVDAAPGDGVRTLRLAADPKPADRHVEGPPLWRRAEPANDAALARTLADDITAWIAQDG